MRIYFPLLFSFLVSLTLGFTSCKGRFYKAGSSSMENTIMANERFYVKQADSFAKNDIVVFNFFGNDYQSGPDESGKLKQHWEKRIFRIIALSGDSLNILNGDILVNQKPVPHPANAKFEYDIFSKNLIDNFSESNGMDALLGEENGIFHYVMHLSKKEAAAYSIQTSSIVDVQKIIREYSPNENFLIKPCTYCHWSVDNFGPLYVPGPGETIIVDSLNFDLYHNIPGIKMGKNIVKEPLYFVLGDNRHAAEDSRYIGYITYSNISGIVKKSE